MAVAASLVVYQINSLDPTPVSQAQPIVFPFAGIMVRGITSNGLPGLALSTGVVVYSQVQVIATGSQYSVKETPAAILALANA